MQSYAPNIAALHVWASTQEHTKNEAFNHGNGDPMAWRFLWALLGRYYGVSTEGCAPPASVDAGPTLSLAHWAREKRSVWEDIVRRYGLDASSAAASFQEHSFAQMDGLLSRPVPGAQFVASMRKAKRFGWCGEEDSYEAWVKTLRAYENAGVLPRRHS